MNKKLEEIMEYYISEIMENRQVDEECATSILEEALQDKMISMDIENYGNEEY